MYTIEDFKLFIPAFATAVIGIITIVINNKISKRQIENAKELAKQQYNLQLQTTVVKEWKKDVISYVSTIVYQGLNFKSLHNTRQVSFGPSPNEEWYKSKQQIQSSLTVLTLLLDASNDQHRKLLVAIKNFIDKVLVADNVSQDELLDLAADITTLSHFILRSKNNI